MALNDIELFQSFCRKYFNRVVKEHFSDITDDNPDALDVDAPRQLSKRLCLHKDDDSVLLTLARLLLWWFEMKGLFDEPFYGIPSTEFHINYTIFPQLKLHFREDKYEAAVNNRKQARSEVSVRWREENYSTSNINALATKVKNDFATPVFNYKKGREIWTYVDKSKGYHFKVAAEDEADAKKIIEAAYRIQDDVEPDWEEFLKRNTAKKNYNVQETVAIMGEIVKKPKKRPIARVHFAYAELFIPGATQPVILVDRTGTKAGALKIA